MGMVGRRGCSCAIVDGRLIRYDAATREEFDEDVTLTIDGRKITVKKAVVATDEQGDPKYDADGEVIPRPTTIYDAVSQRYQMKTARPTGPMLGTRADDRRPGGGLYQADGPAGRIIRSRSSATRLTWTRWPSAGSASCNWPGSTAERGRSRSTTSSCPRASIASRTEMIVDTIASPDAGGRRRVESAR